MFLVCDIYNCMSTEICGAHKRRISVWITNEIWDIRLYDSYDRLWIYASINHRCININRKSALPVPLSSYLTLSPTPPPPPPLSLPSHSLSSHSPPLTQSLHPSPYLSLSPPIPICPSPSLCLSLSPPTPSVPLPLSSPSLVYRTVMLCIAHVM